MEFSWPIARAGAEDRGDLSETCPGSSVSLPANNHLILTGYNPRDIPGTGGLGSKLLNFGLLGF